MALAVPTCTAWASWLATFASWLSCLGELKLPYSFLMKTLRVSNCDKRVHSVLREPFRDEPQDFHLREWSPWRPERLNPVMILFHSAPTLVLFNATKFWMPVENTAKVMVSKDFDVLQQPDFPLIGMQSSYGTALRGWIFVPVGYNSRHNLWVMGNVGRNMDLEGKG